jgi:hypothetical protein
MGLIGSSKIKDHFPRWKLCAGATAAKAESTEATDTA